MQTEVQELCAKRCFAYFSRNAATYDKKAEVLALMRFGFESLWKETTSLLWGQQNCQEPLEVFYQ